MTWPHELTARELLAHGTSHRRLSLVGLVRLGEVLATRARRGLDAAQSGQWVELNRAWLEERFGVDDLVPAVVRCEALQAVHELRLDASWVGEPGLACLLASPHLRHLDVLELVAGLHDLEGFAGLERFHTLRHFALARPDAQDGAHVVGDDLAAQLARLPQLEAVTLPRTPLGPAGLEALLAPARLHQLDLEGSAIGEAGCAALARSRGLGALKRLGLARCLGFDGHGRLAAPGDGVDELLRAPSLRLRELDLGEVPGVAPLVARSPSMIGLEALSLSQVDDHGLEALLASAHLRRLRRLRLDESRLSADQLERFGRAPLLAQLESLHFENDLAASHDALLVASLPRLRTLGLRGNHSTAAALRGAALPALTELRLDLTPMRLAGGDEADVEAIIDALVSSTTFAALRLVVTSFVSPRALQLLEERFDEVRVEG